MAEGASALSLPDLPPDIRFKRLSQTQEAFDHAFEVKRAAMGPHITARWGWDEGFQRNFHQQRFREKPFLCVIYRSVPVGTFALTRYSDHVLFDHFYLLPAYQRRGLEHRSYATAYRLPIA
jgi:hypothetical protein